MKERHEMIQPILSSVLYLTGDANADRSGPVTYWYHVHIALTPESYSRLAALTLNGMMYVLTKLCNTCDVEKVIAVICK